MPEESIGAPPKSYYGIAGVALLWNLVGVAAYIGQMTMEPETLEKMMELQQIFLTTRPAWAAGAFAIAVNAGVIGCILLLLKKSLSYPVLIVSLAGVVIQNIHAYGMSNGMAAYGAAGVVSTLAVVIIGAYLIKMAGDARNNGWLS